MVRPAHKGLEIFGPETDDPAPADMADAVPAGDSQDLRARHAQLGGGLGRGQESHECRTS